MLFIRKISSTGFTLFEILVVMAIIAIVAGLIVPRVGMNLANMKLKAAARGCSALLRMGRSLAITSKKNQEVLFRREYISETKDNDISPEKKVKTIVCRIKNKKRDYLPLDEEISLRWKDDPDGDWVKLEDEMSHTVSFDFRGYTSGGRLKFSYSKEENTDTYMWSYILEIDPITGRVKIIKDKT